MNLSSLTLVELQDLEARAARGEAFGRADAERVMACPDLVTVGVLGETARKALRGDTVTFCRVSRITSPELPAERGEAGEVRIDRTPASLDDARAAVRAAATFSAGAPLTGFSLGDLLTLAGGDHLVVADAARALRADGLEAISATLDRLGDTDNAIEVVRAALHGGLGVWRAIIDRASAETRLDLIERAAAIQAATKAFQSFAPLARFDSLDAPSTGYDDVRTIAVARLVCQSIPSIQIDWSLYGPKLAQVAITYGADDLDAVSPVDVLQLGHRRSPAEDVRRQITSAFANPVERTGRFEFRS